MKYNFLYEDSVKVNGPSSSSSSDSKDGTGGNDYSQTKNDLGPNKSELNGSSEEELKNLKENSNKGLNMASAILGAKITFGENCYKDYMKIIRAHVRYYSRSEADKDTTNKKETETNTDVPEKAKPAE